MARWIVLPGVIALLLLPGCSTIPCGNKAEHVMITKAGDGAVHLYARYLQKKIRGLDPPEKVDAEKRLSAKPAEIESPRAQDVTTMSIKSRAKLMMKVVLHKVSLAVGWENASRKPQYPSDILSNVDSCFFTGKSSDDLSFEFGSGQSGSPVLRVSEKRVMLGLRWKFIAMPSV
jgi:hypothetical protein